MKTMATIAAVILAVNAWAGGYRQGQASGTTNAAVAFAPVGPYSQQVLVDYDVTSDLAGSQLTIETNAVTQTVTGGTNSAVYVASTNGFTAGADVVYWSSLLGTYSFTTISNRVGTTNLIIRASYSNVVAGDVIYQMATNVSKGVGTVTNGTAHAAALYVAPGTNTILLKVTGTSAVSINNAVMGTVP